MRRLELTSNTTLLARRYTGAQHGVYKLERMKPLWRKSSPTRKRMPLLLTFLFFSLFLAVLSYASPPLSRGARPIALGNGYAGVSDDVYALHYNPAGLYSLNKKEIAFDFGRSYAVDTPARTDFNFIYGTPYRHKDSNFPIVIGAYGESPASGAHIVDLTVGTARNADLKRWTRGLIKFPAKAGIAMTLRSQKGELKSPRVGKSSLTAGFTTGLMFPIDRKHQMGLVIKNLFPPDANPQGPSIQVGAMRHHSDLLHMFADLEFGNGGIWRFHPGLEWLLARGVLRPRLGWGFRDSGHIDHLATGVGFYMSPIQLDMAYLIPLKTINDNAGQIRVSLLYRFGNPQFSEIYYDRALEAASRLDQSVLLMTTKEAELKASLNELEQKKRLAKEELDDQKARIQALKDKDLLGERDETIRQLKGRIRDLEGNLSVERSTVRDLREKKNSIRTHKVTAGETLQNIAREYYGDPSQWKRIYNANPDKIERGLPKAGATLVIP